MSANLSVSVGTEGQKAPYVGVDDGHYALKVVTESGQMFSIPSRAKSGKHLIAWQGASEGLEGGIYSTEEGMTFTVHGHLECDDTRFRDYPLSALNRVLVHHALRKAGFAGKPVSIATGLPVSYYYIGGAQNSVLIEGKVANLKRPVKCDSGPCAHIIENVVTTEAIAAYFDQIIAMDGSATAVYAQIAHVSVGIIDLGGKTTDSAVILPGGAHVDTARSGSSDVGVLKLHDQIEAALRIKFGFDQVPPPLIEAAIASGRIKVYGREESVTDIVHAAKEALAEAIMANVRAKIGSGKDLDWVLFVGGGSIVMREQLERHFPHGRFPEYPEFANARGMLKIAKYVFGQKRSSL
jgi:plasmid segregation protein ParM